jgi:hypothetical protein
VLFELRVRFQLDKHEGGHGPPGGPIPRRVIFRKELSDFLVVGFEQRNGIFGLSRRLRAFGHGMFSLQPCM